VHVSYCHNPFRYAWNDRDQTLARLRNPVAREILRGAMHRWRQWDWIAAQRTDRYIANSRTTQARIRTYFGRDSQIIHPPVNTSRFGPGPVGDHYVIVSELMPHKQIDVAIQAFNKLKRPLIVVGDGPGARRLKAISGPTITFAGRLSDRRVAEVVQGARAMIVTSVEEFGIAAVEAQAAGRPAIARRAGGALETIVDGVTGCFWAGGSDELAEVVERFDDAAIDPRECVMNAERFDAAKFSRKILAEVDAALAAGARPRRVEHQPAARRLLAARRA
jgi:glycosyltransferase involved in cell wall biosynthesis